MNSFPPGAAVVLETLLQVYGKTLRDCELIPCLLALIIHRHRVLGFFCVQLWAGNEDRLWRKVINLHGNRALT